MISKTIRIERDNFINVVKKDEIAFLDTVKPSFHKKLDLAEIKNRTVRG